MEKEVSQQAFSPTLPSLPDRPVAQHQDAFGYRAHAKGHFVTAGEKKFDRLTYTTVGYVINALLSVVAVHWVERTPSGQKAMENFVNWAQETFPKTKASRVEMLATKTFFLSGGFAVLAPMKWLEDAKVNLIKKWDRKTYGDAVDTDQRIVQSHKDIEAAPKQGWGSIFASRVLALVPFYITVGALWDRKSVLSRLTNNNLNAVHKEATAAYFVENPHVKQNFFSKMFNGELHEVRGKALDAFIEKHPKEASKGIYFDRPISYLSRKIGKGWAKLMGNETSLAKIEAMETSHPGMIASKTNAHGTHDSDHVSLPYYTISEAITSGMVAWGVYALTRVLGPIMGKKQAEKKEPSSIAVAAAKYPLVDEAPAPNEKPQAKKQDLPGTQVQSVQQEPMQGLMNQTPPSLSLH